MSDAVKTFLERTWSMVVGVIRYLDSLPWKEALLVVIFGAFFSWIAKRIEIKRRYPVLEPRWRSQVKTAADALKIATDEDYNLRNLF